MFARFAGLSVGHGLGVQFNQIPSDIYKALEVDEEPENEGLSHPHRKLGGADRGTSVDDSILDSDAEDPGRDSDSDQNSDHDSESSLHSESDPASDDQSLCGSDDDDDDSECESDPAEFSF